MSDENPWPGLVAVEARFFPCRRSDGSMDDDILAMLERDAQHPPSPPRDPTQDSCAE